MNDQTESRQFTDAMARSAAPEQSATRPARPHKRSRKKFVIVPVALTVLGLAGWYGQDYWRFGRFIESTDDAYVKADIVALAMQLPGRVDAVAVQDNQAVAKGDVLVRLDASDARARRDAAAATLARARAAAANLERRIALQQSRIAGARAGLAAADAKLNFARSELRRARRLRASATVAERSLEARQAGFDGAEAGRDKAMAALSGAKDELAVLKSERALRAADLAAAQSALKLAEVALGRTVLRAPRAGTIGNLGVRAGEYVQPGQQLMSLVPQTGYVTANFKETQIAGLRAGMAATVHADMLGGRGFKATVASLAPASGAEFAVLPPQNATGNFTKIVQRVPVRLTLAPGAAARLRPGTSVTVSIDTREGGK